MNKKDLPLNLLLLAAFISFLFSVFLWFFVDKDAGLFVGILGSFDPVAGRSFEKVMMSIEIWIGGVGIVVFTLVFIAGMMLFASRDQEV